MFFQQLALSPSSKPFSIVFSCPNPLLQGPKSSRHTKNILSHVFCFYPSSPQGWVSSTFDSLKKNNISGWTHLLLFEKGCGRQEVKEQLPVVGNLLCDVEPAFAICTTPCLAGFFCICLGAGKKKTCNLSILLFLRPFEAWWLKSNATKLLVYEPRV